jgi:hypothetical protein
VITPLELANDQTPVPLEQPEATVASTTKVVEVPVAPIVRLALWR